MKLAGDGVLVTRKDPPRWLPNAYIQAVATGESTSGRGNQETHLNWMLPPFPAHSPSRALLLVVSWQAIGRWLPSETKSTKISPISICRRYSRQPSTSERPELRRYTVRRPNALCSPTVANSLLSVRSSNTLTVESLSYRQSTRDATSSSWLAQGARSANVPKLETDRRTLMDKRGEGGLIILDNNGRLSGKTPAYCLPNAAELLLATPSTVTSLSLSGEGEDL